MQPVAKVLPSPETVSATGKSCTCFRASPNKKIGSCACAHLLTLDRSSKAAGTSFHCIAAASDIWPFAAPGEVLWRAGLTCCCGSHCGGLIGSQDSIQMGAHVMEVCVKVTDFFQNVRATHHHCSAAHITDFKMGTDKGSGLAHWRACERQPRYCWRATSSACEGGISNTKAGTT